MIFLAGFMFGLLALPLSVLMWDYWQDYRYHRFNGEKGGYCRGHYGDMARVDKWSDAWFRDWRLREDARSQSEGPDQK